MKPDFTTPAEDLVEKGKEYLDARMDDVKLRLVKGLSVSVSKLLGLFFFLELLAAFVLVFSCGIVLYLHKWFGLSYEVSTMIIAGVLLIVAILVYILRKKLFRNRSVSYFVKLFFGGDYDA